MAPVIPLRPWAVRPRDPEQRLARAVAAIELIGSERKLFHQLGHQQTNRHPRPQGPGSSGSPSGPKAA